MICINTERGWRPLQTPPCNKIAEAPPRYRGELPSAECKAFIAQCEADHQEWLNRKAQLEQAAA